MAGLRAVVAGLQARTGQGGLQPRVHNVLHGQVRISILRPLQGRACIRAQGRPGAPRHSQGQEDLPAGLRLPLKTPPSQRSCPA